ncbi:hypothetical protein DXG03_004254 [Asterophora parasitica]|uniref:Uncharacterized protein n=1 Tax=Asterophora parasitica TaxID=117018 RepID=A0A9P7G480_9AGAR|nr:hypothetical protein DXG03_004254 [Asterophora parasitica]
MAGKYQASNNTSGAQTQIVFLLGPENEAYESSETDDYEEGWFTEDEFTSEESEEDSASDIQKVRNILKLHKKTKKYIGDDFISPHPIDAWPKVVQLKADKLALERDLGVARGRISRLEASLQTETEEKEALKVQVQALLEEVAAHRAKSQDIAAISQEETGSARAPIPSTSSNPPDSFNQHCFPQSPLTPRPPCMTHYCMQKHHLELLEREPSDVIPTPATVDNIDVFEGLVSVDRYLVHELAEERPVVSFKPLDILYAPEQLGVPIARIINQHGQSQQIPEEIGFNWPKRPGHFGPVTHITLKIHQLGYLHEKFYEIKVNYISRIPFYLEYREGVEIEKRKGDEEGIRYVQEVMYSEGIRLYHLWFERQLERKFEELKKENNRDLKTHLDIHEKKTEKRFKKYTKGVEKAQKKAAKQAAKLLR